MKFKDTFAGQEWQEAFGCLESGEYADAAMGFLCGGLLAIIFGIFYGPFWVVGRCIAFVWKRL